MKQLTGSLAGVAFIGPHLCTCAGADSDSDIWVLRLRRLGSQHQQQQQLHRQTDRQTDKLQMNCSGMQWKMPMTYNLQYTQTQTSEFSDTNTINILNYFEMPEKTRTNQKKLRHSDTN